MAGQGSADAALFTEPEVEFLAEDEMINIIPNVRMETLHMICGDFGPFRPQIPVTVPLWLGIAMKKRSKCRIQPPDWMSVERLTEVLEVEREAPREFQPLPFHYVEIARLLLDNAREDFENNFMVQSLLEDIKDVRWDKVEKGLKTLSGRTHAVKLKNLSAMEVNRMRNFTVRALQSFFKHDSEDLVKQGPTDNDSQLTSTPSDRLPRDVVVGELLQQSGHGTKSLRKEDLHCYSLLTSLLKFRDEEHRSLHATKINVSIMFEAVRTALIKFSSDHRL